MLQDSSALAEAYRRRLEESGLDLRFRDLEPERYPDPYERGEFDPKAAKDVIRKLESARGYLDWGSVGTEPRAEFLYRLGTVRARKGPYLGDRLPPLQGVLDEQARILAEALRDAEIELPFPVYAGVYPTGDLNARVETAAGGALVFVNAGLMDLLFCVLKINLATSGDERDPPPLSREQASMALAEAFNGYLYGEGSLRAWPLPRLDPRREAFLGAVLRAAECFVLAHELGHVALGHVGLPEAGPARVSLTPETEFAADDFAVDLLVRAAEERLGVPDPRHLGGGILSSIIVAYAVVEAGVALGRTQSARGTHPALEERLERLAERVLERLPHSNALAGATAFGGWLLRLHLPEAIDWMRAVDETIERPDAYSS